MIIVVTAFINIYVLNNLMLIGRTICEIPTELRNSAWTYKRPGENDRTIHFGTTTLTSFQLMVQGSDYSDYTCVVDQPLSSDKSILLLR